ncbi:MAG: DUF4271 domain-containing protein [Flavobacteriales bacterium]|nr:DUF4271 domain-containing protein [Flavobacteriales bacterium]MBT5699182.1 DUF4271 domain-containing protein [Flavobacteriales bacterium]
MNTIFLPLQFQNISFVFLSISFSIIGFLYAFHKKYAKDFILSAFVQRYANQYLRDENVFKKRVNILFSTLMILNISLFIWSFKLSEKTGLISLIIIMLFVALYYIVKYILIWFLGVLLKMKQISEIALFFTTLFDKVFALFTFPVLLFFHFFIIDVKGYSTTLIFSFLVIFFLLKIFWTLKIGIKSFGLSRFYLFLYICILEFFPLLLLYRGIVFA